MSPLPFEPTGWKTMYLDHISFQCTSYKETVAFYEALLGWKGLGDEGSQNETQISPEIGGLLIRGGRTQRAPPDFTMPAVRSAVMNHISFGISPFDPDKVCGGAVQARASRARRYRARSRRRRTSSTTFTRRLQELPHAHAEQLRPAVQREDLGDDEDRPRLSGQVTAASASAVLAAGSRRLNVEPSPTTL